MGGTAIAIGAGCGVQRVVGGCEETFPTLGGIRFSRVTPRKQLRLFLGKNQKDKKALAGQTS